MYDVNDEDNFSTENDGRSNKQSILIANYSEDTYEDVLDNNICYNDDVFSLKHGKDIFKDFIKKVY